MQPLETERARKAAWKWLLTQPKPGKNRRRRNLAERTRALPPSQGALKAPRAAASKANAEQSCPHRGPAAPAIPSPGRPGHCPHAPAAPAPPPGRPLPAPPGKAPSPPPTWRSLSPSLPPQGAAARGRRGGPGLTSALRSAPPSLAAHVPSGPPTTRRSPCGGGERADTRTACGAWEAAPPPPGMPERGAGRPTGPEAGSRG